VGLIFFALGGLLAGRLFFIQIAGHDFYSVAADRQYTSYQSPESISVRGDIYFKEKNGNLVSAATIRDGFSAAVNPEVVSDPQAVCDGLEKIVPNGFDKDDCLKKAGKADDPFETVAHRLNSEQAGKVKSLNLDGLNVFPEQWRFYPGGALASQLLGFVGYKGNELTGRYGIEQYYEDILKGKKESLKESNSFVSLFFEFGKEFLASDALAGHDVILTIEPSVQGILEDALAELIKKWGADSSGGIIINPQTGAIIAMAGKPDFDSNTYNNVGDLSLFLNPSVSSIFEVGSVMKALTLSAAMDAGKITPQTTYTDNGYVVFNGSRIENYDGIGRGTVDMQAVLNQSLNTGAVFAMQKLGKESFYDYLKNFGLGEKTGIDLPDETAGKLSNLESMRDIEYATASFGQGIAVTPIAFVSALSALANGGVLVKPYVVERISTIGAQDSVAETVVKRRVLKEETSQEITRMLVNVVDQALAGGTVKMGRYSIAAKTGTAQLPKSDGQGYYEDQYFHSFFGYAPAFDAKFLIFLFLKNPQGVHYASQTLTEPFMSLTKFLLDYFEIPPDR